ncbi:type II secretion system F family protein [Pusillimonas sp.]|uniref:type II secretion system F family protein n=1 Tax=Pusillimonas sp. TaxID=3040095 RepID=UPI0037C7FA01
MSTADLIAIVAFAACVLLGLLALVVNQAMKQRPSSRVRMRLQKVVQGAADPARQRVLKDLERAQADARRRRRLQSMGTVGYHLTRLHTISGRMGLRLLVGLALFIFVAALAAHHLGWLFESPWLSGVIVLVAPVVVVFIAYGKLIERFRLKFLHQLPDAMDLIVRATQAGVPATQAIRAVGERFDAPLGPEFRRMGDSLFLGNDLQEVLDDATMRIELPDFSFFSVCLLLQRETGGSLAETLENLSGIIRARRDLRLKTRALTAEGRLAGSILAALPFITGGSMLLINPDYIGALFDTQTGRNMLWTAGVMLVLGVVSIRKISKMEV